MNALASRVKLSASAMTSYRFTNNWQGAMLGYLCGFIWYMGNCYWIYPTMHLFGGLSKPVAAGILEPGKGGGCPKKLADIGPGAARARPEGREDR